MTITVTRDRSAKMRHIVRVGSHSVAVDLAPSDGGEDSGPSPHDLYDASLGACKALTLLWYAQRKGIAVEELAVAIERDDSQERQGRYRLKARITATGSLDQAQRAELLRVAAKCPVHKLMTEVTTEIETEWA